MAATPHRVVIVGAGFGGLETTYRLAGSPVAITLIDRRNHHLFQPLLYQVATASLATSETMFAPEYLKLRDIGSAKAAPPRVSNWYAAPEGVATGASPHATPASERSATAAKALSGLESL